MDHKKQLELAGFAPRRRVVDPSEDLPVNNSKNSPIEVSWIFPHVITEIARLNPERRPLHLGMTLAPGRKNCMGRTGKFERDIERDMDRLAHAYNVDTLVCLLEDFEFHRLGIPTYWTSADAHEFDVLWFPIKDGAVPLDVYQARFFVRRVVDRLWHGERVVLHCAAGLGRTGTIAACMLVELGAPADLAIKTVRGARRSTIEHGHQERFVEEYYETFCEEIEAQHGQG